MNILKFPAYTVLAMLCVTACARDHDRSPKEGDIIFQVSRYRPLDDADKIPCPVLLVGAEDDSLIPIASVDAAARKIPNCEYVRLAGTGHFEPYLGDTFDRVADLEADFLCRHLLGTGG